MMVVVDKEELSTLPFSFSTSSYFFGSIFDSSPTFNQSIIKNGQIPINRIFFGYSSSSFHPARQQPVIYSIHFVQTFRMDSLSSEILLPIFKKLNSLEMVNVMPVCRKWLEIINDNQSLWRRLVLPWKENGWEFSILILFDHKCQSTLKEVSMNPIAPDFPDVVAFCNLLGKSKGTLQTINIVSDQWMMRRCLSANFWKFRAAMEFKVTDGSSSNVQLIQSPEVQEKVATDRSSRLKILSMETLHVVDKSYLDLTANLASLYLEEYDPSSKWRRILAGPSKTLKHLRMGATSLNLEGSEITSLPFPKLQVLEFIFLDIHASQLPRWMSAPRLSSLVTNSVHTSLISTSSVSLLWIDGDKSISRIQETFPKLSQLIYQPSKANSTLLRPVVEMLSQRSQNVAAKMEVDGVEMRQIQKLVLPSRYFNDKSSLELSLMMSDLRKMVEEVVAFESESRIIQMEI